MSRSEKDKSEIDSMVAPPRDLMEATQGNILKAYGKDHTRFLFLKFDPAFKKEIRAWISRLAGAKQADGDPRMVSAWSQSIGDFQEASPTLNIMLTASGFVKLGIATIPNDKSFRSGMKNADLDDHPVEKWEGGEGGSEGFRDKDIHALLVLSHDDPDILDSSVNALLSKPVPGVSKVKEEKGFRKKASTGNGKGHDIEHFGFRDGHGQPVFLKGDAASARKAGILNKIHSSATNPEMGAPAYAELVKYVDVVVAVIDQAEAVAKELARKMASVLEGPIKALKLDKYKNKKSFSKEDLEKLSIGFSGQVSEILAGFDFIRRKLEEIKPSASVRKVNSNWDAPLERISVEILGTYPDGKSEMSLLYIQLSNLGVHVDHVHRLLKQFGFEHWDPQAPISTVLSKEEIGHGSYFVFRKLRQEVKVFSGMSDDAQAALIGRHKDGRVLMAESGSAGSSLGAPAHIPPWNNFNYAITPGIEVPENSHIRLTNSRIGGGYGDKGTASPAIARRGSSYDDGPGKGKGLLFFCAQSSITNQFEVIQKAAMGKDPLVGGRESKLVTFLGGEYFFAPSIPFLISLHQTK